MNIDAINIFPSVGIATVPRHHGYFNIPINEGLCQIIRTKRSARAGCVKMLMEH
jgi:hypothetical protein